MYIIQCYTILYKDLAIYWPLTTEAGCAQQRSYDLLQAGCPLDSSVISSPVSTRLCMFCLDQCAMHLQLWKATEVKCDVYGKRYMSDCVHQGVLRFMSFPKIFIHRGFSYAFTRSPVNYSSLSKLSASCFSALEVASLQAETQHGPPDAPNIQPRTSFEFAAFRSQSAPVKWERPMSGQFVVGMREMIETLEGSWREIS